MMSRIYFIVSSLYQLSYVYGRHYYQTPELDDQFKFFEITNWTPVQGSMSGHDEQQPLGINKRVFLIFNFIGKGNAFLHFKETDDTGNSNSFTVEIGGGSNYDRVAIYNLTSTGNQPLKETSVFGITSDKENRSYWIHWDTVTQEVSVGVCTDPEENVMLWYSPLVTYNISHIYLSTGNGNSGSWEFASDYEMFGGCLPAHLICKERLPCDTELESKTYGTCRRPDENPDALESAICPYICNDNVVCDATECDQGLCVTPTAAPSSTGRYSSSTTTSSIVLKGSTTITFDSTVALSLSEQKVTMRSTPQIYNSGFFTDNGKVAAVFAGVSVAVLGIIAVSIYFMVSRCKTSVILPIPVSTGTNDRDENETAA